MGRNCRAILALAIVVCDAPAAASVKLAGLPDGPVELTVDAGGAQLERTLRLVPRDVEAVTVTEVRLVGCTDGANQSCTAAVTGENCTQEGGCKLTATAARTIAITVATPKAGTYRASLEIVYVKELRKLEGGATEPVLAVVATPLAVTRPVYAALAVAGAHGVQRDLPVTGAGTVTLPVRLQDDAGLARTIARTVATPLVRKSGSTDVASEATVTLYATVGGKRTRIADGAALELPPGGATLDIVVGNLDEPGVYEGKVRMAAGGQTIQELSYTVTVRDGILLAALLIALGAVFSYGVKKWAGKGRARLVQQRELERLRERLLALDRSAERDRRLVDALLREVSEQLTDLRFGTAVTDATITLLARRGELAGAAIRTGQEIERLPMAARGAARKLLDDQVLIVLDPGVDETKLKAVETALVAIASESVKRAALGDLLAAVETAVTQTRAAVDASLQARLTAEVEPPLAAARAAAGHGRLDELASSLAAARRALVNIQVEALARYLPEAPPPAYAQSAAEWKLLRDELTAKLAEVPHATDVEDAVRLYEHALARLATALATAVARWCRAEAAAASGDTAEAFRKLAAEADASRARPPADALVTLEQLTADALALKTPGKTITAPQRFALPPPLADIPALVSRSVDIGGMRGVGRLIAFGDAIVLLVVIVLAVASGLKLLWVDAATWGSWGDRITALLWGAGLHAVGNSPFKGLLGLEKDLGKVDQ